MQLVSVQDAHIFCHTVTRFNDFVRLIEYFVFKDPEVTSYYPDQCKTTNGIDALLMHIDVLLVH